MSTHHEPEIPVGTHCEWCGAEFDNPSGPRVGKVRVPAPTAVSRQEPQTHCEWCGIPYPGPNESDPTSAD